MFEAIVKQQIKLLEDSAHKQRESFLKSPPLLGFCLVLKSVLAVLRHQQSLYGHDNLRWAVPWQSGGPSPSEQLYYDLRPQGQCASVRMRQAWPRPDQRVTTVTQSRHGGTMKGAASPLSGIKVPG